MSQTKPLVVVTQAFSKQGSSVVNSLIQSNRYRVRALTKRPEAPEAEALRNRGVEVIKADQTNAEDLKIAFQGAHGVFAVPPGTADDVESELRYAKLLGDAAVQSGVKHLIFSSIDRPEEEASKRFPNLLFKYRDDAAAYIKSLPITSSFISLAYFYTNFIEYYRPQLIDGVWTFSLPVPADVPLPYTDPLTATGPVVLVQFDNPEEYKGKSVPIVNEMLTGNQIAEIYSKVTGQKARYAPVSKEDFLAAFSFSPITGLRLYEMFQFSVEYSYFNKESDIEWSRRINPSSLTYEQFLRNTEWKGESWNELKQKKSFLQ